MRLDQRTKLWNEVWYSYYDTYYQEVLAESLTLRWQRFDEISKILIAVTASGSALTGWSLWTLPEFKVVWAGLAGFGALLAIVHKSLGVSNKLDEWNSSKSQFADIRFDHEMLMGEMRINPQFQVKELKKQFSDLQKRFAQAYQSLKSDPFQTQHFKERVQDELNVLISNHQH